MQPIKNAERVIFNLNYPSLLREISVRKDSYLSRHHAGVALYSGLICIEIAPELYKIVISAASLHDIGKVRIPNNILFKSTHLTPEEWVIMKRHPISGSKLVKKTHFESDENLEEISRAIRHHHERWNGTGYPDKLAGKSIPLASRIIAVADTFDTMTTTRPYRKALSDTIALEEIERYLGTQFDPQIVQIFLKIIGRNNFDSHILSK